MERANDNNDIKNIIQNLKNGSWASGMNYFRDLKGHYDNER